MLQAIFTTQYVAFGLFLVLAVVAIRDRIRYRNLPPGPRPIPFVGNRNQIPKVKPWLQMAKWAEEYGNRSFEMDYLIAGPIYTLWMGRTPTMVISSAQVAVDLLEKKSNIYSSRPRMVVMGEMYLGNDSTLVMPYGEKWRKHRKLLHSGLMQKAAHSYKPVQELESQRLVWDLVRRPQQFLEAIERYTASVTLMLAFGRRVDSLGDPLVIQVTERNRFMSSINVYDSVACAILL